MCLQVTYVITLIVPLHWRHNDHDDVSNHQPHGCLLNRLFRRRSKKHQSSASLASVWWIHRDRWIPRTNGQLRGKCFHLMTSSCHSRGIDIIGSLKLRTVRERWDYFCVCLMLICIHGLAPHYLSNYITMHVDIHGYDTRRAENMDLYIIRCFKEIYRNLHL